MLRTLFLLLLLCTALLQPVVNAQQASFSIEDVMNKVKETIPTYKFRHYKWPLPPDACYGGETLAPEDIDVTIDFVKGAPSRLMLQNMDLKNNPAHLTVLNNLLKMLNVEYVDWYAKFYKTAIKSKKYNANISKTDGNKRLRFDYKLEKKKFECVIFF